MDGKKVIKIYFLEVQNEMYASTYKQVVFKAYIRYFHNKMNAM